MAKGDGDDFNVSYGLASSAVTTGNVAITTTESVYHGMAIVAGITASADITVYDAISTTAGNVLDRIAIGAQDSRNQERFKPVMAREGIYVVATGTGMNGTVFFAPKG